MEWSEMKKIVALIAIIQILKLKFISDGTLKPKKVMGIKATPNLSF